jgi:phosphate uptake regulator
MEKKLTAQGPKDRKSYTVTLPKEWVRQGKLDKTRLVELEIVGNKIIISPQRDVQERVVISADSYNNSMIKVLQGLYRLGVDEIKLEVGDSKLLEEASEIISQKLIGYEIMEQKEDYIVIKDITKESREDFKTVLRRVFILLLELSESREAAKIRTLDRNIKRLINYCQRILIKEGHTEYLRIPLYYLILDQLEKIGDELKWALGVRMKKEQAELFEQTVEMLKTAYGIFYKFDSGKFNQYAYKAYQLKNEIKFGESVEMADIHLHNLARLLNSLYGNVFAVRAW